jgi:hypothetical protein
LDTSDVDVSDIQLTEEALRQWNEIPSQRPDFAAATLKFYRGLADTRAFSSVKRDKALRPSEEPASGPSYAGKKRGPKPGTKVLRGAALKERNASICFDYTEQKLGMAELMQKYGLCDAVIRRILHAGGAVKVGFSPRRFIGDSEGNYTSHLDDIRAAKSKHADTPQDSKKGTR